MQPKRASASGMGTFLAAGPSWKAPRHQQRAGGFNELENKLTSGMIQRVGPSHRNIDITPNLPFANNKKQDMPKLPAMMCPKNLARLMFLC